MEELLVKSKKLSEYNIYIEDDFERLKEILAGDQFKIKKLGIITDDNVRGFYEDKVKAIFPENVKIFVYSFKPGEASKNLETVNHIYDFLLENDFSRSDYLLALGGGVVGDITGFVASSYKRGLPFFSIPTSLLSMVDSSIGGKCGVDYNGIKNIIGAFNMPELIYINTEVLSTLPKREYFNGFAEIMKAALIKDSKFYTWLIDSMYEICDEDKEAVKPMILNAINIKKAVVEKDPFDHGDRALLNYGHTIGHAIETYFKGEYIHGEAVALGSVAAAYISWKMDMIAMEDYYEIRDMFVPFNLPITIKTEDISGIMELIKYDKKNTDGNVNMILLNKIGKAVQVNNVSRALIEEAIKEINFKDEV